MNKIRPIVPNRPIKIAKMCAIITYKAAGKANTIKLLTGATKEAIEFYLKSQYPPKTKVEITGLEYCWINYTMSAKELIEKGTIQHV